MCLKLQYGMSLLLVSIIGEVFRSQIYLPDTEYFLLLLFIYFSIRGILFVIEFIQRLQGHMNSWLMFRCINHFCLKVFKLVQDECLEHVFCQMIDSTTYFSRKELVYNICIFANDKLKAHTCSLLLFTLTVETKSKLKNL